VTITLAVDPEKLSDINKVLKDHRKLLVKDLANWYRRAQNKFDQGQSYIKVPDEIKWKQKLVRKSVELEL
jgi:hypothetical protein